MAKKNSVENRLPAVNPFCTGPGGHGFEASVAVHFLVKLIRQETAVGLRSGIVSEVRLQQRNLGHPVDDVQVVGQERSETYRLFLQAKHTLVVGRNALFTEVVTACFKEFSRRSFRLGKDRVGIAVGEISKGSLRDLQDLLQWARTSDTAEGFYRKTSRFSKKKSYFDSFKVAIKKALGSNVGVESVWQFLRHFVVLSFDFEGESGRDSVACWNSLLSLTSRRNVSQARAAFEVLFAMVMEYAPKGGELSWSAIAERFQGRADFDISILRRGLPPVDQVLARHVSNRIAAEKNSKKYIPDLFVEIGEVKESARLFCHPALFLRRLEDSVRRTAKTRYLSGVLGRSGLPLIKTELSARSALSGKFDRVGTDAKRLGSALDTLSSSLAPYAQDNLDEVRRSVVPEQMEYFGQNEWNVRSSAQSLVEYRIPSLASQLKIAQARVLALVSRAGQGKTNFVCDLIETMLLPRQIPCVLFTGRELRKVGKGELCSFIAKSVFGKEPGNGIDALFEALQQSGEKRNVPGIFVIDALNEHDDISVLASELVSLIERGLNYSHVRFLVTCRSEYFEQRFECLQTSSFAASVEVWREIHRRMEEQHRDRLLSGYLSFFRVSSSLTEPVAKQLKEDPLLLRLFCEAYGDGQGPPLVGTICKDALFRIYLQRKLSSIAETRAQNSGFLIGNSHPYRALLRTIVEWMLSNRLFANVPISIFDQPQLGALSSLIDEDIVLREDLPDARSVLDDQVISFTFDECRDFLIADHLLSAAFANNPTECERVVGEVTRPTCTVSEGVAQFLFFGSRFTGLGAVAMVARQDWYDRLFLPLIFEVEDRLVSSEDLRRLREAFAGDDHRLSSTVTDLIVRFDTTKFPNLNIEFLFEVFAGLGEARFEGLLRDTFGEMGYGQRSGYPITLLLEHIKPALLRIPWQSKYRNLARLLLYLWNFREKNRYFAVRELFNEFQRQNTAVASELKNAHIAANCWGFKGESRGV